MSDAFGDGRRFRVFNVIDDFSRACLAIKVARPSPVSLRRSLQPPATSFYVFNCVENGGCRWISYPVAREQEFWRTTSAKV